MATNEEKLKEIAAAFGTKVMYCLTKDDLIEIEEGLEGTIESLRDNEEVNKHLIEKLDIAWKAIKEVNVMIKK